MGLKLRALAEELRGSLFYVPSIFVVVSGLLALLVIRIDISSPESGDIPVLLSVTVDSARSILSTIAGATITVAGIVFSVTVVSVQLASSQFSPRVLRGFLRDRFQQSVIGLVVGTFTYCMFVLATTRVSGNTNDAAAAPSLAVTLAIVLAVASMIGIIAFIDHSARAMQVGEIIRRVTSETRDRIDALHGREPGTNRDLATPTAGPPIDAERRVARAWTDGWIQQLHGPALLRALPPGTYIRLDSRVGGYVTDDTPLFTYWVPATTERTDPDAQQVRQAFVIGSSRTMQQDVMFGIRQLVDIGLRALSPGINDPTTAYEVIVHIGSVLSDLLRRELAPRVLTDDEGRVLAMPLALDHADHVDRAFDQLRIAAATQPTVLISLLSTIARLEAVLVADGFDHRTPPLNRQARLIVDLADQQGFLPEDRDRVHAAAEAIPGVGSSADERQERPPR